jgi:hypothetical protein
MSFDGERTHADPLDHHGRADRVPIDPVRHARIVVPDRLGDGDVAGDVPMRRQPPAPPPIIMTDDCTLYVLALVQERGWEAGLYDNDISPKI